jgi:hypothetical protein
MMTTREKKVGKIFGGEIFRKKDTEPTGHCARIEVAWPEENFSLKNSDVVVVMYI